MNHAQKDVHQEFNIKHLLSSSINEVRVEALKIRAVMKLSTFWSVCAGSASAQACGFVESGGPSAARSWSEELHACLIFISFVFLHIISHSAMVSLS